MNFNILVVKETRANESRVGLIPMDAVKLIQAGHTVAIENNAGVLAGFSNAEYIKIGATIRTNERVGYSELFDGINLIIRVKRASHEREVLECQVIAPGTIMLGALDPLEKNSSHIPNYHAAKIIPYSIDQLKPEANDPLNILAAMSQIAGRLCLLDALTKFKRTAKKVAIIGFGAIGRSAFTEAMRQNLAITVIMSNPEQIEEITRLGGKAVILNQNDSLAQQQAIIKDTLLEADIVISSARRANQVAPILIPLSTLTSMQEGSVVVDMALSEGGNVEGSEHDATHILGNGILVTNVSGYPKSVPHEASILWSRANLKFVELLALDLENQQLAAAKC